MVYRLAGPKSSYWTLALGLFVLLSLLFMLAGSADAMFQNGDVIELRGRSRIPDRWIADVSIYSEIWFGAMSLKLDDLNEKLTDNGFQALSETESVFAFGSALSFNDWNYGMFVGSGHWRAPGSANEARLDLSWVGWELTRAMSLGRSQLLLGMLIGVGNAWLTLSEPTPKEAEPGFKQRYDTRFVRSSTVVGPSVGARFPLGDYFGIHVKAGYMFDVYGKWRYAGRDDVISGLPSLHGPYVTFGFTVGAPYRVVIDLPPHDAPPRDTRPRR